MADNEGKIVDQRIERLGAERIEDGVLENTCDGRAAWLALPDAT